MKSFIFFAVLLSLPLQSIAMSDYLTIQCPNFSNTGVRIKTAQLKAGLGLGAVWIDLSPMVQHSEKACLLESSNSRVEVICEHDQSARATFESMKLVPHLTPNGRSVFLVWGMQHSDSNLIHMGNVISPVDGKCILRASH